jgi:hypothetical protein
VSYVPPARPAAARAHCTAVRPGPNWHDQRVIFESWLTVDEAGVSLDSVEDSLEEHLVVAVRVDWFRNFIFPGCATRCTPPSTQPETPSFKSGRGQRAWRGRLPHWLVGEPTAPRTLPPVEYLPAFETACIDPRILLKSRNSHPSANGAVAEMGFVTYLLSR